MYSLAQIRQFFIPRMKRMIELADAAGAFAFHHTDGASRKIIPDMIEAGIDVLIPIQWRCRGMEREGLKLDFGDRLIFRGGVDNQYTVAFGSEEVRQEVIDNLRILGEVGGYILAPVTTSRLSVLPKVSSLCMRRATSTAGALEIAHTVRG